MTSNHDKSSPETTGQGAAPTVPEAGPALAEAPAPAAGADAPAAPEPAKLAGAPGLPAEAPDHEKGPDAPSSSEKSPATARPATEKPVPAGEIGGALDKLEVSLARLSYKNTERLGTLGSSLNRLNKQLGEGADTLKEKADTLAAKLEQLQSRNRAYQEELKQSTRALLQTLKQALEAGKSEEALPAWDRIQGNISNTSGKLRNTLQAEANVFKDKLNELRDWKAFAATEKKKELIAQMQHLKESKMAPVDRSKHIARLHREWKALGHSNQNEAQWKQFKAVSDQAYEPCKTYFRERKKLMEENLKKRQEICATLEQELEAIDRNNVHIANLSKLLSGTDKAWKQYAPVQQAKIKTLQKRYYGLTGEIRNLRKKAIQDNVQRKKVLIEQAQKLAGMEDRRQAMAEARQLQQDWKDIGPTTFREDRKYWEAFRAACDTIFAANKEKTAELKAKLADAEQQLESVLQRLQGLLKLDDADFRKARAEYQNLLQEFMAAMDPRLRRAKKGFMDRFNEMKRKAEARFQALPDRKQQQLSELVAARTSFLNDIETDLFAAGNDEELQQRLAALDSAGWAALKASGEATLDRLTGDRFGLLKSLDSVSALTRASASAEQAFRDLCIDAEIRAGMETPPEDQGRRMERQLAQLQKDFGSAAPDRKENIRYALQTELAAQCVGPLPASVRTALNERLATATSRLRS